MARVAPHAGHRLIMIAIEELYSLALNVKLRLVDTLPGAIVVVCGWVVLSDALSYYFLRLSQPHLRRARRWRCFTDLAVVVGSPHSPGAEVNPRSCTSERRKLGSASRWWFTKLKDLIGNTIRNRMSTQICGLSSSSQLTRDWEVKFVKRRIGVRSCSIGRPFVSRRRSQCSCPLFRRGA